MSRGAIADFILWHVWEAPVSMSFYDKGQLAFRLKCLRAYIQLDC